MATILIVDDRPANRQFLVSLLGYSGHRLLEAVDGAEALATVREKRPDLVLADILMPVMDGYEFVRLLRDDPKTVDVRVIFVTANYSEREAEQLARAFGVMEILQKPCEPESVLQAVERALGSPSAAPPVAPAESLDREHLRVVTNKLSQKVDELQRANDRLLTLVELGLKLGSERDIERLLEAFCRSACELIGASKAVVAVRANGGPELKFRLSSGLSDHERERFGHMKSLSGAFADQLASGACFRYPNASEGLAVPPSSVPDARYLLAAPVVSPSRNFGWICLLDRLDGQEFTAEDERLVATLAAMVGRVYENGSLYADLLRQTKELAREVTERQRAESEVRQASSLLRAVADGTSDAVFVKDQQGRYLLCNPAFSRLVGRDVDEILGRDDTTIFEPASARIVMDRDRRVMASELAETEEETLTASEITRTYLATKGVYRDDTGAVAGTLGISHDITERKRAEATLRLRDRAIQAVPQGILITDATAADHPIIYVSPGFEKLTGYSADEAIGQNCRFLQGRGTDPEAVDRIRTAIKAEQPCVVELVNYRKDGSRFWNEVSIAPVRDDAGKLTNFVGLQSDATARRSLEDQFRQAQKMEAVGRLAGGVAHDFNNLLTVINGYGELVLDQLPQGGEPRELVQEIVNAGQRATGLTRQLLAFSRKSLLEMKNVDLRLVLSEIERLLRRLVGEDIAIEVLTGRDESVVRADPSQIEQVVLNLVVNARDAMPQGGTLSLAIRNVELEGAAAPRGKAGPFVSLTVIDTGCGMDAETVAHAFEPFFTTKGERGTGLGLATVHGVISQCGGTVSIASEPGQGTTFEILLPRVTPFAAPRQRVDQAPLPRGDELILLVEDEDNVRGLARRVLEKCGYVVLECRDGVEALEMARRHPIAIDLLVTDVVMPRMGGRELAEKAAVIHPGLNVLFLSGYTDDDVMRHGIQEAEVAFLQKPFTSAVLAAKVREVLDHRDRDG